jgi:hypothetical protein
MDNPKLFETDNYDERILDIKTDVTLRDLYAGLAMVGIYASGAPITREELGEWCYRTADALLKARKDSPSL